MWNLVSKKFKFVENLEIGINISYNKCSTWE